MTVSSWEELLSVPEVGDSFADDVPIIFSPSPEPVIHPASAAPPSADGATASAAAAAAKRARSVQPARAGQDASGGVSKSTVERLLKERQAVSDRRKILLALPLDYLKPDELAEVAEHYRAQTFMNLAMNE